jgi:hypothetical protein
MKTVMIVLSLMALMACNDDKTVPVDQTRTTSAIVVEPTLHDGHAAEPNKSEQSGAEDESFDHNEEMDVNETDMSGVSRDGGS